MDKIVVMLKIVFTIFIMFLVPNYWHYYGIQNFLWLSDIGLFLTLIGLWLESSLAISICMIAIFPFEVIWNVDFFVQLLTGHKFVGIASYMFDHNYSLLIRIFSLFHCILPPIWLYLIFEFGYHKDALKYATVIFWIVLSITYFFTDPNKNINYVFLPKLEGWTEISSLQWLLTEMTLIPLFIFWPIHAILKKCFFPG